MEMNVAPSHGVACTVVVTFHPPPRFFETLPALRAIATRTIVVDNGSGTQTLSRLRHLAAAGAIDLIANHANLGLAAALNQGIGMARGHGSAWVLLLDQDSEVAPGILDYMAAALSDYPDSSRVAVIGANYGLPQEPNGRYPSDVSINRRISVQTVLITSGSLISVPDFDKIGPFDDGLFIDHVDHEYCLRARRLGFAVIATREVLLTHSIGKESTHLLLGRRLIASNHAPQRRYYMARNSIVIARRYFRDEPRWVTATLRRALRDVLVMLLFEQDRGEKLKWWLLGLWHGVRGKLGPIPSQTP
jgi:rhamnosyltransferase